LYHCRLKSNEEVNKEDDLLSLDLQHSTPKQEVVRELELEDEDQGLSQEDSSKLLDERNRLVTVSRGRARERESERQRQTDNDKQTETETETETDSDKQTATERERYIERGRE